MFVKFFVNFCSFWVTLGRKCFTKLQMFHQKLDEEIMKNKSKSHIKTEHQRKILCTNRTILATKNKQIVQWFF